ncbi:MAG: hypothetical protein V7744_08885 [Pseudomonadales bacterium]
MRYIYLETDEFIVDERSIEKLFLKDQPTGKWSIDARDLDCLREENYEDRIVSVYKFDIGTERTVTGRLFFMPYEDIYIYFNDGRIVYHFEEDQIDIVDEIEGVEEAYVEYLTSLCARHPHLDRKSLVSTAVGLNPLGFDEINELVTGLIGKYGLTDGEIFMFEDLSQDTLVSAFNIYVDAVFRETIDLPFIRCEYRFYLSFETDFEDFYRIVISKLDDNILEAEVIINGEESNIYRLPWGTRAKERWHNYQGNHIRVLKQIIALTGILTARVTRRKGARGPRPMDQYTGQITSGFSTQIDSVANMWSATLPESPDGITKRAAHSRRGHIRRLQNGREVWVRHSIVSGANQNSRDCYRVMKWKIS